MPEDIGYLSKSESDWRAESDHRTLTAAAEVLANRARINGVKKFQTKAKKTMGTLEALLSAHKAKRRGSP